MQGGISSSKRMAGFRVLDLGYAAQMSRVQGRGRGIKVSHLLRHAKHSTRDQLRLKAEAGIVERYIRLKAARPPKPHREYYVLTPSVIGRPSTPLCTVKARGRAETVGISWHK